MHDILPLADGDGVGGGDAVHLVGGHDHRHVRHVARFQHLSGGGAALSIQMEMV